MTTAHVEKILHSAPTVQNVVQNSKWYKTLKAVNTNTAFNIVLASCVFVWCVGWVLWGAYQPIDTVSLKEIPWVSLGSFSVGLIGLGMHFAICGVIKCLNFVSHFVSLRQWRKSGVSFVATQQSLTNNATNEIKTLVLCNFEKMTGSQWDQLAPLLNVCVKNPYLPYAWWNQLNCALLEAYTAANPKVETVAVAADPNKHWEDKLNQKLGSSPSRHFSL